MSQIQSHRRTDYSGFGIKPGAAGAKPMSFKADKCPDRQTDMIALRHFEPELTTFNTGELFDPAMIDLDLPGIQGVKGGLFDGHVQAAGCPIFRVAVFGDRPKHLDPAIPLEMNLHTLGRDEDLANRPVAAAIGADFPVLLELGQPVPAHTADELQIGQPRVPTVERHQLWLKATLASLLDHLLKMVILAQSVLALVVDPKVTRQTALSVGPHQRYQVDALHYFMMLSRPMSADQRHVPGIWLVQGTVIDDQYPSLQVHQRLHLLPQTLAVGRQALQQARVGIMRWGLLFSRVCLRGSHAAKYRLGSDQKVDVMHFVAFGPVHAFSLACPCSTA